MEEKNVSPLLILKFEHLMVCLKCGDRKANKVDPIRLLLRNLIWIYMICLDTTVQILMVNIEFMILIKMI